MSFRAARGAALACGVLKNLRQPRRTQERTTWAQARKPSARPDVKSITHELTRENKPESPIIQALQRQVANAFVLYANYKHYHWQTYGPLFRDLHKLFDQLAEDVLPTLDELAERVRMIGRIRRLTSSPPPISPPSPPRLRIRRCVRWSKKRIAICLSSSRRCGTRRRSPTNTEDPGTVDVFSRLVQIHEKHEWFTRDMLRTGDGLCT
jgi:starvation-inducible DNA-binding protein